MRKTMPAIFIAATLLTGCRGESPAQYYAPVPINISADQYERAAEIVTHQGNPYRGDMRRVILASCPGFDRCEVSYSPSKDIFAISTYSIEKDKSVEVYVVDRSSSGIELMRQQRIGVGSFTEIWESLGGGRSELLDQKGANLTERILKSIK